MASEEDERVSALILRHPAKAAQEVCHEDQLTSWSGDLVGALSLGEFIRDDLSYDDVIALHQLVQKEIKSIVEMAFTHPEALKQSKR